MTFERSIDVLELSAIDSLMSRSWPSQPPLPPCSFERNFINCVADNQLRVQSDIIQSLKMDREHLYQALQPFNRDNLFYEVGIPISSKDRHWKFLKIRYLSAPTPDSQMADICDYIWNLHRRRGRTSSGIIYCRTRATCDELSKYLRGRGLHSRPYHKGLRYN